MASRSRKPKKTARATDQGRVLVVCRGGDCGSRIKHPEVDHRTQLQTFRDGVGANMVVSRCLDACDHSNVCVLVPSAQEAAAGVEPIWLGQINSPQETAEVIRLAQAESFDFDPALPDVVEFNEFRPTRRNRQELKGELPEGHNNA